MSCGVSAFRERRLGGASTCLGVPLLILTRSGENNSLSFRISLTTHADAIIGENSELFSDSGSGWAEATLVPFPRAGYTPHPTSPDPLVLATPVLSSSHHDFRVLVSSVFLLDTATFLSYRLGHELGTELAFHTQALPPSLALSKPVPVRLFNDLGSLSDLGACLSAPEHLHSHPFVGADFTKPKKRVK